MRRSKPFATILLAAQRGPPILPPKMSRGPGTRAPAGFAEEDRRDRRKSKAGCPDGLSSSDRRQWGGLACGSTAKWVSSCRSERGAVTEPKIDLPQGTLDL